MIAIESEREFGLSVLQRLDAELKRRGDLFRNLGVQDLAALSARPSRRRSLPRILLIVDEFQEFFVEDDKIAQDAALLLDRLVRQGRAFGMHVLLGSQTLGGAYSLARSTIGQMAVRIALQCSETDAHLILSEENSAARLLSRPGEAIYNDANGLVKATIRSRSSGSPTSGARSIWKGSPSWPRQHEPPFIPQQIVFEGNVPADMSRNRLLADLLSADDWSDEPNRSRGLARRGDRDQGSDGRRLPPAERLQSAVDRPARRSGPRRDGHGAGQPGGAADSGRESIAQRSQARRPRRGSTCSSRSVRLSDPAPTLTELAKLLPHPVRIVGRRDVPEVIGEIAAEVERRHAAEQHDAPAIYLFIFDLARFRDLRRGEDYGYSFSSEPRPANPGQQFVGCSARGSRRWRPHDHLVRHAEQLAAGRRSAGHPRVRPASALSDERRRFEPAHRHSAGQQTRPEPRLILQRGRRADREIPSLRLAKRALARLGPRTPLRPRRGTG